MEQQTEKQKVPLWRRRWFLPAAGAAGVILALAVWLCAVYVTVPGGLCRRDTAALDLRTESMTPAEFDALQA